MKVNLNTNKIIIGVTQFGMPYGIMNKFRLNRKEKLKQILNFSKKKKFKLYILPNIMETQINFLEMRI